MGAGQIRAGRAFVEVGGDSAPLSAALARVRAKLSAFGQGIAQLGGTFAAGGVGMLGAIAWPLKLAANMETTKAAFTGMLKDAERAQAVLDELQRFAASTPFEFPELADAARGLLAFGVAADDLIPTLQAIGDVSSAINAPIGEIAELYGKARVQGRLFMEDINQLTGRGIPIIQELAKQFGVAESEVRGLVEKGQVNFGNLQRAFVAMTTGVGQFAGQMDAKSKTANGRWSTLKDNISQAIRPIGDALLPAVGRILDRLSQLAAVVGQFISENAALASYVAASAAALVVLGGALSGVGFLLMGVTAVFGFMGGLVTAFAAALSSLVGLIGPVLVPLAAIGGAAFGIATVVANFVDMGAAARAVGDYLATFATLFGPIREAVGRLGTTFSAVYQTILMGWQGVVNALAAGDAKLALEVATAGMAVAWEQGLAGLTAEWSTFTGGITSGWQSVMNAFTKGTLNALANVSMAWDAVITFLQNTWDRLTATVMNWIDTFTAAWIDFQQLVRTTFGLVDENAAAAKIAETDQNRLDRRDARKQTTDNTVRQRTDDSRARAQQIMDDTARTFNAVDQQQREQQAARAKANEQALKESQERLKAAQQRFTELNTAAAAAAAAADAAKGQNQQKKLTEASTEAATKTNRPRPARSTPRPHDH